MRSKIFTAVIPLFAATLFMPVSAQTPSAQELLARIDRNEIFETIQYEGEMIIEHNNRRFVKTMNAWARENSDSLIEFTNPEDIGTRYLRRGGRFFVYSPDNEGVMLISGHMLRESMMGSDMSYEDAVNNEPLSARYDAQIVGSDTANGREAWILELNAKNRTESYPKRKIFIDKEYGDVLRSELFALSGAMLKVQNLIRTEIINGRRFPVEIEVRDLLRRNSRTVFVMRNVILDQEIPDAIFSTRNLER